MTMSSGTMVMTVSHTGLAMMRIARTHGEFRMCERWSPTHNKREYLKYRAAFFKLEEQGVLYGPSVVGLTEKGKKFLALVEEILTLS